jgi:hypothetical protein
LRYTINYISKTQVHRKIQCDEPFSVVFLAIQIAGFVRNQMKKYHSILELAAGRNQEAVAMDMGYFVLRNFTGSG